MEPAWITNWPLRRSFGYNYGCLQTKDIINFFFSRLFLTLKPNFDGGKVKKTKQTTTTTYEAMSICICEHMCVLKKKSA